MSSIGKNNFIFIHLFFLKGNGGGWDLVERGRILLFQYCIKFHLPCPDPSEMGKV